MERSRLASLGRLISYSGLLLVFAVLKFALPRGAFTTGIATMLSGVIAILGALGAFGVLNWATDIGKIFCRMVSDKKPPFYLGLLTGMRPCAPLIAALTFALTLSGFNEMSPFIVSFWLASSVLILILASATGGLASKFGQRIGIMRLRRIGGITLMVVGLVLVVQSITLMVNSGIPTALV